ncbi:3-methyl-2-oxobutanoate hydroxymethyltransferase [Calditerricola satsumensis]|uniref:3-methyl-2-oxobutanoate hydroxymethyltransferase n=1 Tax=Calditerricola satsumensis TaxID=373054 RepID=A0A8J3FA49_9BACI|nr:3-methyl-2-oxobutanoate hydroxymethyltransferase [Calditerricola satsumensis]GGJ96312.1 3-methyl-2-oxobutanoate hydroxymethyltransferase [Calditerricola satsumensis]
MNTVTVSTLKALKQEKRPIVMVTAYDYPTAKLVDEAGVDVILVGDSLGMVVLGYDSTIPVTLEDMVHHTRAVARGAKRALIVADMPFLTYHGTREETLKNAGRLIQEGHAHAVKMEGGEEILPAVRACVQAGIPVMGHLGLTPQAVHQLGGYKVQGKDLASARKIVEDAKRLEEAGAFAIVLECVPEALARLVTETVSVPTIGIGAGAACDGQVLVFHDLVGFASDLKPKFVKQYADIGRDIRAAVARYAEEVRARRFPGPEHTFSMADGVVERLYGEMVR